jgi:acetolactate synthase-1/2/3 large subunit
MKIMNKKGAEIFWECIVKEGVEVVFGYPGGAIMPIYDSMLDFNIHHVLTRHEQGAAFAADGYARITGKVGMAMATSGPGATNFITGIATAMMDSVPIVFVTGQVPSHLIGGDAFQETDVIGISLPVTKHNYLVTKAEDVAQTVREAFHIARSGRPGPVLIDICKDAQINECEYEYPEDIEFLGYHPPLRTPSAQMKEAAELINLAKRPIILAGHGIQLSGASQDVFDFAEKTQTPVAMTLLGLGSFPSSHPYSLGMMGMHGEVYCNNAIQNADLILAFGMRFDDRVTGNLDTYAPKAKKIHFEIDPSEIGKNVVVDIALVGDLRNMLVDLEPLIEPAEHEEWLDEIGEWRSETEERDIASWPKDNKLYAAQVIKEFWKSTKGDEIVTTGVGQHQMWTAQYYQFEKPGKLITSGGSGTMGFGLPSALGAWFGNKDKEIWTIEGDGSFQMSLNEMATVVQEKANVKILVINNNFLGMVRQWQEFFFDKRYAATPITSPDFVKVGEAYGVPSRLVTDIQDIDAAIQFAKDTPGPVLIEFQVEKEEAVFPMVPAGASLNDMIRRPIQDGA